MQVVEPEFKNSGIPQGVCDITASVAQVKMFYLCSFSAFGIPAGHVIHY